MTENKVLDISAHPTKCNEYFACPFPEQMRRTCFNFDTQTNLSPSWEAAYPSYGKEISV